MPQSQDCVMALSLYVISQSFCYDTIGCKSYIDVVVVYNLEVLFGLDINSHKYFIALCCRG